jgi:hypothetical protein
MTSGRLSLQRQAFAPPSRGVGDPLIMEYLFNVQNTGIIQILQNFGIGFQANFPSLVLIIVCRNLRRIARKSAASLQLADLPVQKIYQASLKWLPPPKRHPLSLTPSPRRPATASYSYRSGLDGPELPANSATVRPPLMAASAICALNAALRFFRVRFMSCSRAIRAFYGQGSTLATCLIFEVQLTGYRTRSAFSVQC